jgi:hypothetical protein
MDAEAWKYGEPPELSELRRHRTLHTRLLLVLPQYQIPLEGYVGDISPNGEFIYMSCGWSMAGWFARSDIRIVDILPPKARQDPKNLLH